MGMITRSASTAACALIALAGCGESTAEPEEIRDDPAMRAHVNGTLWEANYQLDHGIAAWATAENELEIAGLQVNPDESLQQITVLIEEFSGVGTYTIGGSESPAGAYYVETADRSLFYGSGADHTGSVTVDTLDTDHRWVTGTFRFSAVGDSGQVEVTEGSFQGRYAFESVH